MALIIDQHKHEGAHILVWKDEEPLNFFLSRTQLSQEDFSLLEKYNVERRKKDLLISRFLIQKIIPQAQVVYLKNGKPFLNNNDSKISISHTKDLVAVIIHPHKHVAIDIEYISSRIEKLKHRFLSEKELEMGNTLEKLTLFWSAKESLFKYDEIQGLDFKKDLKLSLHNQQLSATIRNKNTLTIKHQVQKGWVMTYIV